MITKSKLAPIDIGVRMLRAAWSPLMQQIGYLDDQGLHDALLALDKAICGLDDAVRSRMLAESRRAREAARP